MKKRICKPGALLLLLLWLAACEAKPGPTEVPSDVVLDIHVTALEELWISTANGAELFSEDGGDNPLTASGNYVWEVATDSTGMAWIATTGGTFTYGPNMEGLPTLIEGVPASTISVDPSDVAWVGTPGYGIAKISDASTVTWFETKHGLPSGTILSVFSTTDGDVWAGTDNGMAILDHDRWNVIPALEGLRVFEVSESSGKLLAATDKGAYISEDKATWYQLPGTPGRVVTAIEEFRGDLILGTKEAEFIVYQSGDVSRPPVIFANEDVGLSYHTITSIAAKGNDVLLVGSFGGGLQEITADDWVAMLSSVDR